MKKPPPRKKNPCVLLLLIVLLGFAAYINGLNGQFLYDDTGLIENNAYIQDPLKTAELFTKGMFAGAGRETTFYRPLQMVSYTLNYAFCKLKPTGYHLTNVLLHVAVSLCIFWLLEILFADSVLSFITAVLFAVHPIQTEAVTYISGRGDILADLFMLLCFIAYVKLCRHRLPYIPGYFLVLATYACALLSKEQSIVLPLLLLLYHAVFKEKIDLKLYLSIGLLLALYALLRLTLLQSLLPAAHTDTVFDRIPGLFIAILTYIKLLFLPFPLHMEYGSKLFMWTDYRAILGLLLTMSVIALGYIQRNNAIILFSLGWFFLALIPVSNLYKIDFFMAEHFLYVPSLGLFLAVAYPLSLLYNNPRYKAAGVIVTSLCVLYFLFFTWKQNPYWQDPLTFYTTTLKYAPDSANANNNLGEYYEKSGNLSQALAYYSNAIAANPDNENAYYNRGSLYEHRGFYEQALADLKKAIALNPQSPEFYNNLGIAYDNLKNPQLAIQSYTKAIAIDPEYTKAYINRAGVFFKMGDYPEAISDYSRAIELGPADAGIYNNRSCAYFNDGDDDLALSDLNKTIELNPDFADAYRNRGIIYSHQGNYHQAVLDLNKAIELDPDNASYRVTRDHVLSEMGTASSQ